MDTTKRYLAQFLYPLSSTYFRVQRLYLLQAIDEWWGLMRKQLAEEFSGQSLVIGGDGQCYSPSFNAKNLCYFLVAVNSNYIIHVEVLHKRHVGLISTNMEQEGLKRSLSEIAGFCIVELVTDASSSTKKFIGKKYVPSIMTLLVTVNSKISEINGMSKFVLSLFQKQFKKIKHSLDAWHKSKSIKKCLTKVSSSVFQGF